MLENLLGKWGEVAGEKTPCNGIDSANLKKEWNTNGGGKFQNDCMR